MPDIKEPEVDPTGPADIKEFKVQKNSGLKSALLSEPELAAKKEADATKAAEDATAKAAADAAVIKAANEDPPVKKDGDHTLPNDDDPFEMDDPMVTAIPEETDGDPPPVSPPVKDGDDDLKKKKEGNSGLRDEVRAANSRIDEQKGRFEGEITGLNDEITDLKRQLHESSNRLAYRNPDEHPDVQAITGPWDEDLNTTAKEMTLTGSDGERLKSLIPELVRNFNSLDESASDYNDRKDQIIDMVAENFPDDRKDVIKLISRGSDALTKANAKINEVRQNGRDFEVGQANANHEEIMTQFNALEKTHFNPSDELRQADPLNPKVLLRDLIDSDDRIKQKSEKIKNFVRFAMTPLALPKEAELQGMDEDQANHLMQRRTGEHLAAKRRLGKMMVEALMSHAMFPVLSRDLAHANEALSGFKSNRPAPGSNDDDDREMSKDTPPTGDGDIKKFKPERANLRF